MTTGIKTFMSASKFSLSAAIIDAEMRANAWLARHQWMASDGQSAYVLTVSVVSDDGGWTYIMHLLGNMEETP